MALRRRVNQRLLQRYAPQPDRDLAQPQQPQALRRRAAPSPYATMGGTSTLQRPQAPALQAPPAMQPQRVYQTAAPAPSPLPQTFTQAPAGTQMVNGQEVLPVGWAKLSDGSYVQGWNDLDSDVRSALAAVTSPYLNDYHKQQRLAALGMTPDQIAAVLGGSPQAPISPAGPTTNTGTPGTPNLQSAQVPPGGPSSWGHGGFTMPTGGTQQQPPPWGPGGWGNGGFQLPSLGGGGFPRPPDVAGPPWAPGNGSTNGPGGGTDGNNPGGGGGNNLPPDHANPIEMNPFYVQGLAALDAQLDAELTSLGVEQADVLAINNLINARLGIEHQEGLRQVDESSNARGLYNSGIRTRDRGYTDLSFSQRFEDLGIDTGSKLRDIAHRRGQAESAKKMGVADLALRVAEFLASRGGLDIPSDTGGGNGGGGNGGGGGNSGGPPTPSAAPSTSTINRQGRERPGAKASPVRRKKTTTKKKKKPGGGGTK